MIQIKKSTAAINAEAASADAAALGALVKFGPRKRQVIRLVEAIAGPAVAAIDRGRPAASAVAEAATDIRHILVIEYWNLGDMVMESPFLMNLRIQYPNARITLLTSPKVAPLIAEQQLVDEIVEVQAPWTQYYSRWRKYNPFSPLWGQLSRTLRTLRMRQFDLAFSARADLRDNFTMWFVNARRRIGYAFGGGGMFLTDRVIPDLRNPHFSNRWNRLLEHLGKPILQRQPRLRSAPEELQDAKRLLQGHGVGSEDFLIAVHPGARSVNRQWGEENFSEVAARLLEKFPVKIIWFQEPGHQAAAPEAGDRVISLSLPLRQFMAVLRQCGMFICNDSGPMHISTALDVPVVAVFGPTEPAWFGPLGANHQIVIRAGFWCRPCFDYCIFDQPYCLRTIGVQDVYQAAEKTVVQLLATRSVERMAEPRKNISQVQNA